MTRDPRVYLAQILERAERIERYVARAEEAVFKGCLFINTAARNRSSATRRSPVSDRRPASLQSSPSTNVRSLKWPASVLETLQWTVLNDATESSRVRAWTLIRRCRKSPDASLRSV